MVVFDFAKTGQQSVFAQPLYRQHPISAVVQFDQSFATPQSGQQCGQRGSDSAKINLAVKFKPVNA